MSDITQMSKALHSSISEVGKVVIGYEHIKRQIHIALLCDGHVILESVPGLAKTTLINALQMAIKNSVSGRIQMTPDLKPGDILGFEVYNPKTGLFEIRKGPMTDSNFLLADELNRATPKTGSAFLQAMQERFITIGNETFKLKDVFLVLATMNPIEQEGTYPIPEAMLDRFCFKLNMGYLDEMEEFSILANTKVHGRNSSSLINPVMSIDDILAMRKEVALIRDNASVDILKYITRLVRATRPGDKRFNEVFKDNLEETREFIAFGASPRALIWTLHTAAANAFLDGRNYITPDDVKAVFGDVLRHRIILSQTARFDGYSTDTAIESILAKTPVVE